MAAANKKPNHNYTLQDLLQLMARLRDPQTGCPWDIKQTFATIVPSTLEEAYEVADAIESGDYDHLKEELGDLLFQVVFYAQLGKEQGFFDFDALVSTLVEKLISRHPHVFPDGTLESTATAASDVDVKAQWEAIKSEERARKGKVSVMADVPIGLPATTRAQKLQKRASNVGFDFYTLAAAMEKVHEELAEVEQELARMGEQGAQEALGEELGDLLFSVINVCRLGKFDAESLLRATNRKFESRFLVMESLLESQGLTLEAATLEQMEAAWVQAKLQP
ncbi:nucleoside triphosphate pyrophosphohydrolase [Simiduia sp. 21SJ11W-1]|uniref:nucleoside triphosphate pyrophosphohydrolase n=1 Tax=Simiduia sp. 21SJ11W-1 TaxID=2909669 RepID=UPI0020A0C75F|nr:nucleoside triphosphate pyrophosphohydrolase [Simiduia sp. 21SJ11W-1]UTA46277.1 nucleoside triphosphate pyrophosphohydrolase [Simiduia sp. 21SJ11W-1]